MALHPILALDHVIEEYSDYLHTEFRAKDPALKAALERELDQPLFLAQEPFYQAHRPFKPGRKWKELPIDGRLATVMEGRSRSAHAYIHQSQAIDVLLSPSPAPVVVTTGTGSGKSEAFLLPVMQNAIADATAWQKSALTAILVYPMNALANDQMLRIGEYLRDSGWAGAIKVAKYDRSTSQADREDLRRNPPHILLTNYMMLEYLLVRPADRDDIFANHRCRFLVLDEVHTYRGTLGSNIAMLVRRLRAHLRKARQDWKTEVSDTERPRRYPALVPVGTSATIKSVAEVADPIEARRLRDESVADFFGRLTGTDSKTVRVFGEELEDVHIPEDAQYSPQPAQFGTIEIASIDQIRHGLCRLTGLAEDTPLVEAARRSRLLWDLNRWLIRTPMSADQLVERVRADVPERADADAVAVRVEVEAALVLGAALPEGTAGALRLRAHRFIRGGWQFHRCLNPDCGKLFPMGEEKCDQCGYHTAPLYLCRACGADYFRFTGEPDQGPLIPCSENRITPEWMLFEHGKFEMVVDEDQADDDDVPNGSARRPKQMKKRPVLTGSFDPVTMAFSQNPAEYRLNVTLAPARNRCLCCGGTAGSRNVVSPVALGTSAAVKVLSEGLVESLAMANRDKPGHDGKERLLVFSDSRQDAAHQARFIIFASRYDRLRRRLVGLLEHHGALPIQRTVELLAAEGITEGDTAYPPRNADWVNDDERARIQAWEEAPLLDEIAVNAGYRATAVNLGLVGVIYDRLGEYVQKRGGELAAQLGISTDQLVHLCRCVLDEVRVRGCLSRPMLQVHPSHTAFPIEFRMAQWERRIRGPAGYAATPEGKPVAFLDTATVPSGVKAWNSWRREGAGGTSPRLERIIRSLLNRFGGKSDLTQDDGIAVLDFLVNPGGFLIAAELKGARQTAKLLQLNAGIVRLTRVREADRRRCNVCSFVMSHSAEGQPCPKCHGKLVGWSDAEAHGNRTVRRILADSVALLVAAEHTAQVPNDDRAKLEENFKAPVATSRCNLLACSPTLEMGIDVGGLDAVVLRNIPPRPDNYAQRGGRAGRRSRVGLVLGYARSTPHDRYFFDKPTEMIAGQVPAPALSLSNRDVILRHINAIAFGAAEPGLAGRLVTYVSPSGTIQEEEVGKLLDGLKAQTAYTLNMARDAFGAEALTAAGLPDAEIIRHLESLPKLVRGLLERTARQVIELKNPLTEYVESLQGRYAAQRAGDLVARLLGIPSDNRFNQPDADDRSAGYPLRRFAEFGILPGYEFPSEPATLRLLGDEREEDPLSVARRLGINQFRPDAQVYARTKRWKVIGLDRSSPWNPQAGVPGWTYYVCKVCNLRYSADQPKCPRCAESGPGAPVPAAEYAGFLGRRDEGPILDEEDRFAARNLVTAQPQWDGDVVARWNVAGRWNLRLSHNEEVRWLNEGFPPSPDDPLLLHSEACGYLLCGHCGHILQAVDPRANAGGRRRPRTSLHQEDPYGHGPDCVVKGQKPTPVALVMANRAEVLRLIVPVPPSLKPEDITSWGYTLGYSMLLGMQRLYMLDGSEIDFISEGPWTCATGGTSGLGCLSLTFIDPSLGGSGYLHRIASELHLVARRAIEHLDHPNCESACYRCLKSYQNQRFHDLLRWPLAVPDLQALAGEAPLTRPLQTGDIDNPGPWLDAYAAGVGSPLELKFLRLFEQHGLKVEKQVPVAPTNGEQPISIADFAIPSARVAIYIDGAAFHSGPNLRRDARIRERLRNGNPPWKVVELRAQDLSRGEAVADQIRTT